MFCVILTYKGFPHGGAEEFLFDRMTEMLDRNHSVFWVYFDRLAFTSTNVSPNIYGINEPQLFKSEVITEILRKLNPDFIWTIGFKRKMVVSAAYELGIPAIAGFHFWRGLIDLNPKFKNVNILENLKKHTVSPDFQTTVSRATIVYTPSLFLQKVVKEATGTLIPRVHYSTCTDKKILEDFLYNPSEAEYVTMINVHKIKGGDIFEELCSYQNVKLLGIVTEGHNTPQFKRLQQWESKYPDRIKLQSYCKEIGDILKKTRIILVASTVDETFSRVTIEAMTNGIPILGSRQGNLAFLLNGVSPQINAACAKRAARTIASVYEREDLLQKYSERGRQRSVEYSAEMCSPVLDAILQDVMGMTSTVMFCAPWCLQGLGIQTKIYIDILEEYNIATSVFSYRPSHFTRLQFMSVPKFDNPLNWKHGRIYQSDNSRDQITVEEFVTCIHEFDAHTIVVPEPTQKFSEMVERVTEKIPDLRVVYVPNLETIDTETLAKFPYECMANNQRTHECFEDLSIKSTLVGFSVGKASLKRNIPTDKVVFLAIGGNNAARRKNLLPIFKIFRKLGSHRRFRKKFLVIFTYQSQNSLLDDEGKDVLSEFTTESWIHCIKGNIDQSVIDEAYSVAHVNISISISEGLGIGLYEAISHGIPAIATDVSPHNELFENWKNGWLIPATEKKIGRVISPSYVSENVLEKTVTQILFLQEDDWKQIFRNVYIMAKEKGHGKFQQRLRDFLKPRFGTVQLPKVKEHKPILE